MRAWHVALTHAGEACLAEDQLRRQGFEVFNPKVQNIRIDKRGTRFVTERQYIPGYMFVAFDWLEDIWQPINWTRGVRKVMMTPTERPIAVREDAMELMLACVDHEGYVVAASADAGLEWLRIGRTAKITAGPFAGRVGTVAKTNGDRVTLLMSFMNSTRPVEMRARRLEPVAA